MGFPPPHEIRNTPQNEPDHQHQNWEIRIRSPKTIRLRLRNDDAIRSKIAPKNELRIHRRIAIARSRIPPRNANDILFRKEWNGDVTDRDDTRPIGMQNEGMDERTGYHGISFGGATRDIGPVR
mmetsp:Transcript_3758/g.7987  ORF Transcript_3758/g.7987 Transcript_3758/m.7987 type:complete len:124 (-) Transcript_3758:955-1326(-)